MLKTHNLFSYDYFHMRQKHVLSIHLCYPITASHFDHLVPTNECKCAAMVDTGQI